MWIPIAGSHSQSVYEGDSNLESYYENKNRAENPSTHIAMFALIVIPLSPHKQIYSNFCTSVVAMENLFTQSFAMENLQDKGHYLSKVVLATSLPKVSGSLSPTFLLQRS